MYQQIHKLFKLTHHQHSGRHRPHEHTSHGVLVALLLLTGGVLALSTFSAQAQSPPPQAESVGLTGEMPGPPPEDAATITSPVNQQRFSESPITVEGTCPEDSLVEILKNNIFAGSTLCRDDGTYSLDIDLLIGENNLVARVYNSLNQPGPNSDVVTVFYDAVPPQADPLDPFDFSEGQLLLNTDAVYRGTFPKETLSVPVEIINGTPPFALEVRWGDNNRELIPRENNQPFRISHEYDRPGSYQINLQVTDSEGRIAFLTTVAVINGQPSEVPVGVGTTTDRSGLMNLLVLLWPVFAAALAMVLSFWAGEQREKRLLASRGLLLNNQT